MVVAHLDELQRIAVAGVELRPVRRALGVTAFGINAFAADAGAQLIEDHNEQGGGAGEHEELYLVVRGHATFTVADEEIDAPAGTLVFVPTPGTRRGAVAVADDTVAVVVGGPAGAAGPVSAWEHYFVAAGESDPARRYEIMAGGLVDYPDHPSLHYELACAAALSGEREKAIEHLQIAFAGDPRTREWAREDSDLAALGDFLSET